MARLTTLILPMSKKATQGFAPAHLVVGSVTTAIAHGGVADQEEGGERGVGRHRKAEASVDRRVSRRAHLGRDVRGCGRSRLRMKQGCGEKESERKRAHGASWLMPMTQRRTGLSQGRA